MKSITESATDLYERVRNSGVDMYSDQDVKNDTAMLNHWNGNKNVGRAKIKSIPNSLEIPESFIAENLEAVEDFIKIRKFCKGCEASTPQACPYDNHRKEQARKWEREEGISRNSIKVSLLKTSVLQRRDKAGNKYYKDFCFRPELIHQHDKFFMAYGKCPVSSEEYKG